MTDNTARYRDAVARASPATIKHQTGHFAHRGKETGYEY
jgi:hypothetical protein